MVKYTINPFGWSKTHSQKKKCKVCHSNDSHGCHLHCGHFFLNDSYCPHQFLQALGLKLSIENSLQHVINESVLTSIITVSVESGWLWLILHSL